MRFRLPSEAGLFKALGALKAREHASRLIRNALLGAAAQKIDPSFEAVQAGINALVAWGFAVL